MSCQLRGQVNCRRAVRTTDDGDRSGLLRIKSESNGNKERNINTELCSRSEKQAYRVGKQRAEIGHSSDTEENKTREYVRFNAGVNNSQDARIVPVLALSGK